MTTLAIHQQGFTYNIHFFQKKCYVPINSCFLQIYRYAIAKNRSKFDKMSEFMEFLSLIGGVYETFT